MRATIDLLISKLDGLLPRHGIVLGSGLGSLVDAVDIVTRIPYSELDAFPVSAVSGHAGELVAGKLNGVPVIMLSGRVHYYEKGDAAAMRRPLEVLKGIGVTHLILTNSAGSLREDMPPGSVMRISDHINFTGRNPLIGEETDARFVGLTNAYDTDMAADMERAAMKTGVPLKNGVYMWFSGPSFETPAEIVMARRLGADLVGMSSVPETLLARRFGLRVAAVSAITNLGAGIEDAAPSHGETQALAARAGVDLARLLRAFLGGLDV